MKLFIKINVFCSCYLRGNFCVNPPSTPGITIETNILKSECFCECKKQFRKGFLAAYTAIWGGMIIFLQNHLVSPFVNLHIFFCLGLMYKKKKTKKVVCWRVCLLLFTSSHLHGVVTEPAKGISINSKAANNKAVVM